MIFSISSYLLILLLFDQSYYRTDMLNFYFFKVFWALSYLPTSIDTERYFFRIRRNSYSQATFLSLFTNYFKNLKKNTFHSQMKTRRKLFFFKDEFTFFHCFGPQPIIIYLCISVHIFELKAHLLSAITALLNCKSTLKKGEL